VDLFVGLVVILAVGMVGNVIFWRGVLRMREASRVGRADPRHQESARQWLSLSAEQRRAAMAQMRRGEAISDPQTARMALAHDRLDREPLPAAHLRRAATLSVALVSFAFIGVGVGAHVSLFVGLGVVLLVLTVTGRIWLRNVHVRAERSRKATRALHG